jgi:hypothetical protein
MNGLNKDKEKDKDKSKEIQGQANGEDNSILLWKLFRGFNGDDGEVKVTIVINTWVDLPHEYGSVDIRFVELCTDPLALYKAGTFLSVLLYVYRESLYTSMQLNMILIISHFRPVV